MRQYLTVFASVALTAFVLASYAGYSQAESSASASSAATVHIKATVNRRVELTLDEPVQIHRDATPGNDQVTFIKGTIRANTDWVLAAVIQDPSGANIDIVSGFSPSISVADIATETLTPGDVLGRMVVLERGSPTSGHTFEHELRLPRPTSPGHDPTATSIAVHYIVMPVD
ncbi:MAG TPA: hypothetical protein GX507_05475 [Clostridia bacterium]|nr:hypothetical protein [Clostridia bacterium]